MKNKNDKHAWQLIEEMEWDDSGNYKELARYYFNQWGKAVMYQLRDFAHMRVVDLYNRVREFQNSHNLTLILGSDDSMSDLLWHVVGLGETAWRSAMNNPVVLESRHITSKYRESFSYCFHEPDPEVKRIPYAEIYKTLPIGHSVPFNIGLTPYVQLGNAGKDFVCLMPWNNQADYDAVAYLEKTWNDAIKK